MSAPKLLALDTSTEACSAALAVGEQRLECFERLPRGHAERVLGMIDELLAEAGLAVGDLDALAFCRGPGSFTGVRIGVGVVQGLAFGADLPVAPVSTLAALAQGAIREHGAGHVLAAIDARMGEVYWARFRRDSQGLAVADDEERVASPETVHCDGSGWVGVGTGWASYADALSTRCHVGDRYPGALPRALDGLPLALRMLERGEAVAPEHALPAYLRDRVTG